MGMRMLPVPAGAFQMAEVEVTADQFRRFRADYSGHPDTAPYACGISWDEAVAFCSWLSQPEGRPAGLKPLRPPIPGPL